MTTRLPFLAALGALLATSACSSLIVIDARPVPPTAGDDTPPPPPVMPTPVGPGPTPSDARPTTAPLTTPSPVPTRDPNATPTPGAGTSPDPNATPTPDPNATPVPGPTPTPRPPGPTPTPWPSVSPTPTIPPVATPTPTPVARLVVVKTIGKARNGARLEVKPGAGEIVAPSPATSAQLGVLASLTGQVAFTDTNDQQSSSCFADGKRYDLVGAKIAWPGGSVALSGETIENPTDLAVKGGQAYVASKSKNCVYRVDLATGTTKAFAGTPSTYGGFADGAGAAAAFNQPNALIAAPDALYVADTFNRRIRKVTYDGIATTLTGGRFGQIDGPPDKAAFTTPTDLTRDDAGMLYVADQGAHAIRQVAPDGTVSTLAGSGKVGSADGGATEAAFYFPTSIGHGAVEGKPVLVVGQNDGTLRLVHGW